MSILWGWKMTVSQGFPLTKPMAVNTGLARVRRLWWKRITCRWWICSFFPIYQGTWSWQPNNVVKMYQHRLIPPALGALELENELQYHGLVMRVNSAYDACISCENFVKFGRVTPELTGLICERQVWRCQKTGIFCRISLDILDYFCNLFTRWERITCRWWICSIFPLLKGRGHGNRRKMQKFGWFGGLGVTQGHRKHCHLIECIRLPIRL